MAEKRCTRGTEDPLCCEVPWLRRRRELEEMPMSHVDAREESAGCAGCGCCPGRWEELAGLLEEQNRLLYDLLGAVNALAAAQLALRK